MDRFVIRGARPRDGGWDDSEPAARGDDSDNDDIDDADSDGVAQRALQQTAISDYFSRGGGGGGSSAEGADDVDTDDDGDDGGGGSPARGSDATSPLTTTASPEERERAAAEAAAAAARAAATATRARPWFQLTHGRQLALPPAGRGGSPPAAASVAGAAQRAYLASALARLDVLPVTFATPPPRVASIAGAPPPPRTRRGGVTCIQFDALGALVAAGGDDGVLRLYDYDSLWAARLAVRNVAATNASVAMTAPPTLAPLHAVVLPGPLETLRWHPGRPDDVLAAVSGSPDVFWYDMGALPSRPTRVLTRAGDVGARPGGASSGATAGNTDIAFLADVAAVAPTTASLSAASASRPGLQPSGPGRPGGVAAPASSISSSSTAAPAAVGTVAPPLVPEPIRNGARSALRRRLIAVKSAAAPALAAAPRQPTAAAAAVPQPSRSPPSRGYCVLAGDGLGCVRLWDVRIKAPLRWALDSVAALQAFARSGGSGAHRLPPTASFVGQGAADAAPPLPLRGDQYAVTGLGRARFGVRSVLQSPAGGHEAVVYAASAAGTLVGWDTRKLGSAMFAARATPMPVVAWDTGAANSPMGGGASRGCAQALVDPDTPHHVTLVHTDGCVAVHELATGRLVRATGGGGGGAGDAALLRPRPAAALPAHVAPGVLVVPQRYTVPAPSVTAEMARSGASLAPAGDNPNARTHFRGGEGEWVSSAPPPEARCRLAVFDTARCARMVDVPGPSAAASAIDVVAVHPRMADNVLAGTADGQLLLYSRL